MPKSKYGRAHQLERERWQQYLQTYGSTTCHAIACLMSSRVITPDMLWDLGHNTAGTEWTGPEHRRCNRVEGASRGNRMRNQGVRRWIL